MSFSKEMLKPMDATLRKHYCELIVSACVLVVQAFLKCK